MSQPVTELRKGVQASKPLLSVLNADGAIWSHIRNKYLVETPEERVRQTYLVTLVNEYGYTLDQIDEEVSTAASVPTRVSWPWRWSITGRFRHMANSTR